MGAFKATLEEMRDADLLLHVVDASNPRFEAHITQVNRILEDLELGNKPQLLVFNKSDLLKGMKKNDTIAFLKVRQFARTRNGIMIAANDRASLHPLLDELQHRFWAEGMEPLID
jgi:GTP-binding protein HflX